MAQALDRGLGIPPWLGALGQLRVRRAGDGRGRRHRAVADRAEIGEQVANLRFMPAKTAKNSRRWCRPFVAAGPGWVILGAFKQLGGAFLAFYVAVEVGLTLASEPIEQFIGGFDSLLPIGIVLGLAGRWARADRHRPVPGPTGTE